MQKLFDKIKSFLPKDKVLHQFADQYLCSYSTDMLEGDSPKHIAGFIEKRFSFLKEGVQNEQHYKMYPALDTVIDDDYILETAYPDTTFFLITLMTFLKKNNLAVTKLLHPIISVELNSKNEIKEIHSDYDKGKLLSLIYIEFEGLSSESKLLDLKSRLNYHIQSTICAHEDYAALKQQLVGIRKQMGKMTLDDDSQEWLNLVDWLLNKNFTLIGYIPFAHKVLKNETQTICDESKGLGILTKKHLSRDHHKNIKILSAHVWRHRQRDVSFMFDSVKIKSPIHRFENLMRLSLRVKEKNTVVEHNFVGLLRTSSLLVKNLETPLIHLKIKHIIALRNILDGSYNYNALIRITTSMPKYELFRRSKESLLDLYDRLVSTTNPNEVQCFEIRNANPASLSITVLVPNPLFNEENQEVITSILCRDIPHTSFECIPVKSYDYAWMTFHFEEVHDIDFTPNCGALCKLIGDAIKPWHHQLADEIDLKFPGGNGKQLYQRYEPAFPSHYRARKSAQEAVIDIEYMEKLAHQDRIQFRVSDFFDETSVLSGKISIVSIYNKTKIDLITIMPILENLGVHVYDELTTKIKKEDHIFGYIHSFRISMDDQRIDSVHHQQEIVDFFAAVFDSLTENDPLNGLIINTPLNWRSINVLQLYRNVYLQLEAPFSKEKVNQVLLGHKDCASLLFQWFETKFSLEADYGKIEYRKKVLLPKVKQAFFDRLRDVQAVSDDTILRSLANLIECTLRTNFYVPKSNSDTAISIKLASSNVHQMPQPAPYREIYVHDVHMEGTHLRFGAVARGGLRWSDRPFDFRREILDLVKTQQTKNVVIVPVGSKGGFVIKKPLHTKEERATESQKQYQIFIQSLLDLTDNLDTQNVPTPPSHVICYDEPDPYLVVAADKGTASFSDLANSVSVRNQFWLEDAFASGGSQGYNHKDVGITARGAWESAKIHFKEMDIDLQKDPVTVAAIGDMAGDVFGNGMLLSQSIKLVAAFNHMHIFMDPNPHAAKSWAERKRLFDLPQSSWLSYKTECISKGGGIFERHAKSITLSPEMKKCLGTQSSQVTGEELVKLILKMPVQMFFFGGIGTYIKATSETHQDVGDPGNDGVRVSASDVNAQVFVEGANLGMTQKARIELGQLGGRVNKDAIDNSAGVNMSDMEVNLKILMKAMLTSKKLKNQDDRNDLLRSVTEEIADRCLANNQNQHYLISMDLLNSKKNFHLYKGLINQMVVSGQLHPEMEHVTPKEMMRYETQNKGVSRAILATIQAHTKMELYDALLASDLLEHDFFKPLYQPYFPPSVLKKDSKAIFNHKLKKEICATIVTNYVINNAGSTFLHDMLEATGASIDKVIEYYMIFDHLLQGDGMKRQLIDTIPLSDAYEAIIHHQKIIKSLIRDAIMLPNIRLSLSDVVRYEKLLADASKSLPVKGAKRLTVGRKQLYKEVPILAHFRMIPKLFYFNMQTKVPVGSFVSVLVGTQDMLNLQTLQAHIKRISAQSNWEYEQIQALSLKISWSWLKISEALLSDKLSKQPVQDRLNPKLLNPLTQYLQTLRKIKANTVSLTNLSVVIFKLENLAKLS